MRALSALFILSFIITLSSCEKWEKRSILFYWFQTSLFKVNAETILNINDIEILYTVFCQKKEIWRYRLVIENLDIQNDVDRSDKVLVYEEDVANLDEDFNIQLIPDSNSNCHYRCYFENGKKNFKVSLAKVCNREIIFWKLDIFTNTPKSIP